MHGQFARQVAAFPLQEGGPTAAEYAVMPALIVSVIISVGNIGNTTSETYANPRLQNATGPSGS